MSLEQIFLGGAPAERRRGVNVLTTQGPMFSLKLALRQRGTFTYIPLQRWETLSGADWLQSEFGKALWKTEKEP